MAETTSSIGANVSIDPSAIVGLVYKEGCGPARIGDDSTIRAYTIIHGDVTCAGELMTGPYVFVREHTEMGRRIVLGTGTIIDGYTKIGNSVKVEGRVYIPTHTEIGDDVFIGPGAVLTNDRYPLRLRDDYRPEGPTLADSVTIGANATILPGVCIGEGAMVAAGAVVTHDVPAWHMAVGVPAEMKQLPERLQERNRAKRW